MFHFLKLEAGVQRGRKQPLQKRVYGGKDKLVLQLSLVFLRHTLASACALSVPTFLAFVSPSSRVSFSLANLGI